MSGYSKTIIALIVSLMASGAQATLYNLFPDPGLSNGYGYSGTITTDDSVGTFTDVSSVFLDWSITMTTPGDDGVTSRTITAADSVV